MSPLKSRFLAASCLAALCAATPASAAVILDCNGFCTNPVSDTPITVDGAFTDGLPLGPDKEWWDVMPQAFIASPSGDPPAGIALDGTPPDGLLRTTVDDPNANSFLYAAVAPGAIIEPDSNELYLLYDYLDRTDQFFEPFETFAEIRFPLNFEVDDGPVASLFEEEEDGPTFESIPIVVSLSLDDGEGLVVEIGKENEEGTFDPDEFADLFGIGIEAAFGFGPSPHEAGDHLIVELEVGLAFEVGDTEPTLPGYSPDPAFWQADAANDSVDPPISFAQFTIDPTNGQTTLDSLLVPLASTGVPEPGTFGLLGLGLAALGAMRRRQRRR